MRGLIAKLWERWRYGGQQMTCAQLARRIRRGERWVVEGAAVGETINEIRQSLAGSLARELDQVLMDCIGAVLGREWTLDELRGRLFVVRETSRPGWETWFLDDDSGVRRNLALIGPVELVQSGQKYTVKRVIHPLVVLPEAIDD